MVHQGTLFLTAPTRRERIKRKRAKLPGPLQVFTSPITTGVLGAALGALLFPAAAGRFALGVGRALAPTTFRKALTLGITVPAAAGILTSPRARRFIKKTFDPREQFRRGEAIGRVIDDPSRLLPSDEVTPRTVGEKIKDIAIKTGLIGGAVAATVGAGALLVPAARGALARRRAAKQPVVTFEQLPAAVIPALPSISTITQPLGAVQKPIEPEKEVPPPTIPQIKIINKPQNIVDVRINQSRKFINQQVLIK